MSETLITVEGVSKKFCRSLKKSLWYGLQDLGREITGRRHGGNGELRPDEFWAVKDVSFELKRGECLGLIGRNGAGKTTLLRMLNGLIKPDTGRIEMRGRVGALIALGAGFNPILTGRENIHVNASLLGLTKLEIDAKLREIIHFADIGDFIDAPVQSYSSGMQVRLGFASASVLEPDVLLLDEVLAVGDAAFVYKCYRRMDQLLRRSAVIFVSHNMPQVARVCDRTLLLKRGKVAFAGSPADGIEAYQSENESAAQPQAKLVNLYQPINSLEITGLPDVIDYRSPFSVVMELGSNAAIGPVTLRLDVKNSMGSFVASCAVNSIEYGMQINSGKNSWKIDFASFPLKSGYYIVNLSLADDKGALIAVWHNGHQMRIKGGHSGIVPDCQLQLSSWSAL